MNLALLALPWLVLQLTHSAAAVAVKLTIPARAAPL